MTVHAIILTFNEEKHIARCIASIRNVCDSITIVDCGSTDGTVRLAREAGAEVLHNEWVNYAVQMNYAIDKLKERGGWLFRIDADEVLEDTGTDPRKLLQHVDDDVDGILVQRRIHFMGRRIRYGGIEPSWQLRLWRNGKGRCEKRWMDEHIKVSGRVVKSDIVIADINLNSLSWWTDKHNSYASREAIDILNLRYGFLPHDSILDESGSPQAKLKRIVKERLYARLPGGLRAMLYFIYRYVLRGGFLDGKEGYYFHFLQAFWYRTLVDAKVFEIEKIQRDDGLSIEKAIEKATGIDVSRMA